MTALTWSYAKLPWLRLAGQATSWWLGELAGLLPATLRSRLAGQSGKMLRLDFRRDGASLLVPGRDRTAPAIIPVALKAGERALFEWSRLAHAPVQVGLDDGFVFRPVVDLPLAAEASLDAILRNQLERMVPLDPATLRFTWSIVERVPDKSRLKVEVCIVKQVTIDRAMALVRELGLTPRAITVDCAGGHPQAVWRAPATIQVNARERTLRRALEISAAFCALTAYGLLVWHFEARRAVLQDLVSGLQAHTSLVEALSVRASTSENTLSEVNTRLTAPSALAVIDALTRAIPLDSSVSEFHMQDGKVEITGTSAHATMLLAAVEKVAMFEDAGFTRRSLLQDRVEASATSSAFD